VRVVGGRGPGRSDKGLRSVTACPHAAIRAPTPVSRSVEGASGDMAEPVASCDDSEANGSLDKYVMISGRAVRCLPLRYRRRRDARHR